MYKLKHHLQDDSAFNQSEPNVQCDFVLCVTPCNDIEQNVQYDSVTFK